MAGLSLHDALLLLAGFLAGLFVSKLLHDAAARKAPPPGPAGLAPKEPYAPPPGRQDEPGESDELNIRSRSGFYKRR